MKKIIYFGILTCIGLIVACNSKQTEISVLKNANQIEKIEILYGYEKIEKLVVSDSLILQKSNTAFKSMIETDKFYGGYSNKSVKLVIYKGKEKVNLLITHSPFYGWILASEKDNTEYDCPYIFNLVDSFYNKVPPAPVSVPTYRNGCIVYLHGYEQRTRAAQV